MRPSRLIASCFALLAALLVAASGCSDDGSPSAPGSGAGSGGGSGGNGGPSLTIEVGRPALQGALVGPDEPLANFATTVTFRLDADSTYFNYSTVYVTGKIRGDTAPDGWVRRRNTGFGGHDVATIELDGSMLPEHYRALEPVVTTDWRVMVDLVDENDDTDTTLVFEPGFSIDFLRPKSHVDLDVEYVDRLGDVVRTSFTATGGGTYPSPCDSIVREYWNLGGAQSIDGLSTIAGCLARVRYGHAEVEGRTVRVVTGLAIDWDRIGQDVPTLYCPPGEPCVRSEVDVPLTHPHPDSLLAPNGTRSWNFETSAGSRTTTIRATTHTWY